MLSKQEFTFQVTSRFVANQLGKKKKKKKIVELPSSGISEYLGQSVGKYFFFTQKYKIWVHFLPFFSKKVNNTQPYKNWVHSQP